MTTLTATRPVTPASGQATRSGQQAFRELAQQIHQAGLMERRLDWYAARVVALLAGFAGAFALLLTLGRTPWQLVVAALFGVLFTQTAFFGHDAAHQQVFSSGRHNERLSRVVANLIVGLSYGWWARKHGKHHSNPNTVGKDGDIATGALVFVPGEATDRSGVMGWITRHQGWLFFPMLTLEGFNLHASAIQAIAGAESIKHRRMEAGLIAIRLIGFPLLLVIILGPVLGLAFLVVELVVFGVYMGACFAPNHKGMPLIGKGDSVNFFRRQVMTSRNVRGGWLTNWAMGGLNYQIEHHLFPRMPSVNLRRAQPIVREFCAEQGIPYVETSLGTAYKIVIRYLNRVGLGHADPFECPFVMEHRPY